MHDPRGLIREAYNIENIDMPQCRAIFLDWALGAEAGNDALAAIRALLAQYEPDNPDHPMTEILKEGALGGSVQPGRVGRSGRRKLQ
ncbi:hypothetical protein NBRC116601_09610 [Cognatishimia sp. WU-CL00825]|uniref:hypothetical protein n=1 Tax=Cognatishimia sp. WU-CL00825 TaxID=3127658 RepID=UPI00310682CA